MPFSSDITIWRLCKMPSGISIPGLNDMSPLLIIIILSSTPSKLYAESTIPNLSVVNATPSYSVPLFSFPEVSLASPSNRYSGTWYARARAREAFMESGAKVFHLLLICLLAKQFHFVQGVLVI